MKTTIFLLVCCLSFFFFFGFWRWSLFFFLNFGDVLGDSWENWTCLFWVLGEEFFDLLSLAR